MSMVFRFYLGVGPLRFDPRAQKIRCRVSVALPGFFTLEGVTTFALKHNTKSYCVGFLSKGSKFLYRAFEYK